MVTTAKCKNLHGHTYRLQVEVGGPLHASGPKAGMVMDYADLKDIVKRHVVDPMDHAFLYDTGSPRECRVATLLQELDSKVHGLPMRTTAENISAHIFHVLQAQGLPVSLIRLWEPPHPMRVQRMNSEQHMAAGTPITPLHPG